MVGQPVNNITMSLKINNKRNLEGVIESYAIKEIAIFKNKLELKVFDEYNKQYYLISNSILNYKNEIKEKGLWLPATLNIDIRKGTPLGILMEYLHITSLNDFINLKVDLIPNNKNYLIIKGY